MALAGALEIQLLADIARLQKDMDKAHAIVGGAMSKIDSAVGATAKALGLLGVGLSVGALVSFVRGAIDAADELGKLAQRTGIATEQLSQLRYAAKLADVSNESLTTSLKKLNLSIAAGRAGDKEKIASFKQLGITTDDLGKGTVEVMLKMADAYATARDGAGKQSESIKLLGKAGDEMIPLLNGGAQAIRDLMKEADKLGLTIGSDFAEKAEEFNDNMTRMRTGSEKLAISLAGDLIESLGKAAKAMAETTMQGGKFAGLMAGLQMLLTGDDRHKANVKMTQLADDIFKMQDAIDKARARGDETTAKRRESLLAGLRREHETHRQVAAGLDEQAAAAKKAADAIKAARENGKDLKDTNTAGAAALSALRKQYDDLIERIQERITLQKAEAAAGRELTEEEKFALKVKHDLAELQKKMPGLSKATVDALLKESAAIFESNTARVAQVKLLQAINEFHEQNAQDQADASVAASKASEQIGVAIAQQFAALKESNEQLELEARLLGATDRERQIAIEHLRIEQQLRKQIEDIKKNSLSPDVDIANATEAANMAKQLATQRAGMDEQLSLWNSIDQTAHDVWTNIWEGGSNVFKKLGQVLKASLLDALYKMAVRPFVMNIMANVLGLGGMAGAAATGAVQGGVGALTGASIGGLVSAGVGQVMAGYQGATLAAGLAGPTTAGAGGLMGFGSMLAAIPGWGWAAMAAAAIAGILANGGETRVGGQYSNTGLIDSPSGGQIGGASDLLGGTIASINATLKALGATSQVQQLLSGLEQSEKGKGFAYAGGFLTSGASFGQGTDGQGFMNRRGSMSDKEALAAFVEELAQVRLETIQASDATGELAQWVRSLGDISGMSAEAIAAAVGRVDKVIAERASLEERLFQLTATEAEQLARARQMELDAVDEFNRGLLLQIHAQEDLKRAADEAAVAVLEVAEALHQVKLTDVIEQFLTPAEVKQYRASQIADQFNAATASGITPEFVLGLDRQEFRDLFLQFTAEGKTGLTDAMLNVAELFASITEPLGEFGETVSQVLLNLQREGQNLDVQILEALGRNEEAKALLRTIETAGFTPEEIAQYDSNAAKRLQLQGILDAVQAERDLAAERERAAAAAESLRQRMSGLADGMLAEAIRLRGVMASSSSPGAGLAFAQSQFAISLARARAGDLQAGGNLSGLSQAVEQAALQSVGSLAELNTIRAQLATSLEGTAQQYDPVVAELRETRAAIREQNAEIKGLRQELLDASNESNRLNRTTAETLEDWNENGMPQERDA